MKKQELEFDGERVVDNKSTPEHLMNEHLERYSFAKRFVKNKIVLDLACGTGYGSFELAKAGAKKVIGGDISKKAIQYAKGKYIKSNLVFFKMDGEKINLPDKTIDMIVSFETIEHVPNYQKFIFEINRILKKGGIFVCSSPNKEITSPFTKKPLNSYHVKEFKIKELIKILKETGFKDISAFGQSFVNNNISFKIKNFIRSYFLFLRNIYKKLITSTQKFESSKYVNKIRKLESVNLEPTYFILVAKKK